MSATPVRKLAEKVEGQEYPSSTLASNGNDIHGFSRRKSVRGFSLEALSEGLLVFVTSVAIFYVYVVPSNLHDVGQMLEVFYYRGYLGITLLYAAAVFVSCARLRLYEDHLAGSALDESLAVIKAVLFATLFIGAYLYVSRNLIVSRLFILLTGTVVIFPLIGLRYYCRKVTERRTALGYGLRNALIIGTGKLGQSLALHLQSKRHLGYVVKGFVDHDHQGGNGILGSVDRIHEIVQANFIDDVFITVPYEKELVKKLALEAPNHRTNLNVILDVFDGLGWYTPLEFLGDFPVMILHRERTKKIELFLKRVIDIVGSAIGLAFLSPLLLIVAIAIKLDSRGTIFYRPLRVGKKGRTFVCYKFRSMEENADEQLDRLRHLNEREGLLFKISNDPRTTRLGKLLRKYSLDELPQLVNVLKGEMSLVGPRPPEVGEYERYKSEHLRRLQVSPGITGLWQTTARQDPSFERYIRQDIEYIENWSLWMDIKILVRTVPVVLKGTGR